MVCLPRIPAFLCTAERKLRLCLTRRYEDAPLAVTKHGSQIGGDVASRIGGAEKEVAMPWLAADPVIVLPAHREALEALVRAHSTSQQLALRARMILHAAALLSGSLRVILQVRPAI